MSSIRLRTLEQVKFSTGVDTEAEVFRILRRCRHKIRVYGFKEVGRCEHPGSAGSLSESERDQRQNKNWRWSDVSVLCMYI